MIMDETHREELMKKRGENLVEQPWRGERMEGKIKTREKGGQCIYVGVKEIKKRMERRQKNVVEYL